ncbi:MAG: ribosomal RNA small subunit methyltransferase A [Verrucomicrobia bacterium]|jgi:16S rRNA (adenine1518-N6/adenine1519-N6)-dimethyltransferase|nr:ribosomal RNA small subunit methyltransferase A [Verrucomicrobiota bacterium]
MTLSEIKQLLLERDIRLTKSLGQNFLHDQNQIRRIADAAQIQPGEKILEIGPGLGPLTRELLARKAQVKALEVDRRLIESLEVLFENEPNLTLQHIDALAYLKKEKVDWSEWKLAANLPYSVASPILVELALSEHPPQRMTATLQSEVVDRIASAYNTKTYGVLTLLIQARFQTIERFKIPATCFFPEPDVESACVTLERRKESLLTNDALRTFVHLVKLGFSQRRKIIWKLLKQRWKPEVLKEAQKSLNLDPMIRAQAITFEQFVSLANFLHQ